MHQNLAGFNPSLHFTRKELVDCNLSLLSDLSYLFYLQRNEPLSYAIAKVKLRKALKLTLTDFSDIYTAYVNEREGK